MNESLTYAEDFCPCFQEETLKSILNEVFEPILNPGKPYLAVGFSLVHAKSSPSSLQGPTEICSLAEGVRSPIAKSPHPSPCNPL